MLLINFFKNIEKTLYFIKIKNNYQTKLNIFPGINRNWTFNFYNKISFKQNKIIKYKWLFTVQSDKNRLKN